MISHMPSPGLRMQSMCDRDQFAYGLNHTRRFIGQNKKGGEQL